MNTGPLSPFDVVQTRERQKLLSLSLSREASALSREASAGPFPTVGKLSYKGKVPIKDDEFTELLLALPEPLPNDLMKKIRAGGTVEIDYRGTSATVTATAKDGTVDTFEVEELAVAGFPDKNQAS